jgi:hypothetical protein
MNYVRNTEAATVPKPKAARQLANKCIDCTKEIKIVQVITIS